MAAVNDWRQRHSIRARARAATLAAAHSHYNADDLLRVTIADEFSGDLAIASSFGAEALALLALAAEIDTAVPVLCLVTGNLFPETVA